MRLTIGSGRTRQSWDIGENDVRNKRHEVNALFHHVGMPGKITRRPLTMLLNNTE